MRAAAVLVACWLIAHPAAAQGQEGASITSLGRWLPSTSVTASDIAGVRFAPPVRFEATPPSFEVIQVPVPTEFQRASTVSFTIRTGASIRLLGAASGSIGAGDDAAVLLTLQLPSFTRAGSTEVAVVAFEAPGRERVEVPVQVVVPLSVGIEIDLLDAPGGVEPGGDVVVDYAVRNTGNSAEAVVVEAIAPRGWETRSGHLTRFLLAAGDGALGRAIFRVQRDVPPGVSSLELVATVNGAPVESARARVEVLASGGRGSSPGPVLTAGLTHASDDAGSLQVGTLRLRGPVAPGVHASGEFSTQGLDSGRSAIGLSRLGFGILRPHLDLEANNWQVQLGGAGQRLPEVAGGQVGGHGIAAGVEGSAWRASALLATPVRSTPDREGEPGVLGSARISVDRGPVVLSASGARLRDQRYDRSELDAFGLGLEVAELAGARVGADIAHRRFAAGGGLGLGAHLERRGEVTDVRMRWNHAPGGRSAFARASDELDLSLGYAIHERVRLHGTYRGSRDEDAGRFRRLATLGSSAGVRFRLSDALGVSLGGRLQRLDAGTDAGRLATEELAAGGGFDLRIGLISGGVDAVTSRRRRETAVLEGSPLVEEGRRLSVRARLMARGRLGSYGVNGTFDRSERGAGAVPRDLRVSLRGSGIPLVALGRASLTGDFDVGRAFGYGPIDDRTTVRAGIEAALGATAVAVAVARDPHLYLGVLGGGSPWSLGVRVERRLALPPLWAEEMKGVVFRDLDGDGKRGPAEPGAGGIVVRSGGRSAVSDEHGIFRLPGPPVSGVTVDVHSLPSGWVAGPASMMDGGPRIALTPLSPVRVTLSLELDGLRSVAETELERVTVTARHETGRVWVARRESTTAVVFDALPPGHYQLEVLVAGEGEPLQVVGDLPAFQVREGARAPELSIALQPRTVRIRRLEGGPR
jgi:hypothetical protein